jgi:phosphoserine aminotransferase
MGDIDMTTLAKPAIRPARPEFSSGPCAKRPGWTPENLSNAVLGRSHRSKPGKSRLKAAIDQTREVLEVPADFLIGIVAGSDTGAVEMAMWSMLGARPVQLLAFESFGKDWVTDVTKQLKLPDVEVLSAPYGELPDTSKVDPAKDLVFTWNGTTSGVRVPNADFISADREGIVICDATSAFCQEKVTTSSFSQSRSWAKARTGS